METSQLNCFRCQRNGNDFMKFKLTSIILLGWLCLSVIISGCNSGLNSVVVQRADHWIVLDAESAQDSEPHLSWQFQLNNPGKYDIQILSKGILASPAPVVQIEVAALEITGGLKQDYLIEAGTVSQLKPAVTIDHPGNYQQARSDRILWSPAG